MKQLLALAALLLMTQACSNGDSQNQNVSVKSSDAGATELQGKRGNGEDIYPANDPALQLASCEKVNKAPDSYNEEERIRCSQ